MQASQRKPGLVGATQGFVAQRFPQSGIAAFRRRSSIPKRTRNVAGIKYEPAIRFDGFPFFARDAVQLVNPPVHCGVGRGDFAVEAVEYRRRAPIYSETLTEEPPNVPGVYSRAKAAIARNR